MDFNQLLETLIVLFAVLILGYIAGKCKIIDERGQKTISKYIAKIASPLLILSSVSSDNLTGDKSRILVVLLVGIGLYVIMPLVAKLLVLPFRVQSYDQAIYEMMYIFSNAAFLAFPVLRTMYGAEAVFYAAIINISFNLCIYSYGVYILMKSNGDGQAKIPLKNIVNPGVTSAVFAMVIYLCDIPLPGLVVEFCSMVGETTIPLSMLVIGVSLAFVDFKELFTEPKIYLFSLIRLVVLPIITFYILRLFIHDPLLIAVVTVIQAMPSGTLNSVLSTEYGGNSQLAAKGVFFSTLCCIITIPFIVWLLLV